MTVMQAKTIVHASERRSMQPERWAPAFRLRFHDGALIQESERFYPRDEALTFATQAEADGWADREAKKWCAEKHPGVPVDPPT